MCPERAIWAGLNRHGFLGILDRQTDWGGQSCCQEAEEPLNGEELKARRRDSHHRKASAQWIGSSMASHGYILHLYTTGSA